MFDVFYLMGVSPLGSSSRLASGQWFSVKMTQCLPMFSCLLCARQYSKYYTLSRLFFCTLLSVENFVHQLAKVLETDFLIFQQDFGIFLYTTLLDMDPSCISYTLYIPESDFVVFLVCLWFYTVCFKQCNVYVMFILMLPRLASNSPAFDRLPVM